MALDKKLCFLSILLMTAWLSTSTSEARLSTSTSEARRAPQSLAARLQSGSVTECWDSLIELKSCTGEVILFFLNGETYLGPSCCRAIRVIETQCWAAEAMLTALGFTAEEGDVLRGFCGAIKESPAPPPPLVAPAPVTMV